MGDIHIGELNRYRRYDKESIEIRFDRRRVLSLHPTFGRIHKAEIDIWSWEGDDAFGDVDCNGRQDCDRGMM